MTQVAVIDVETTGLRPFGNDRIIEIAAVVLDQNGRVTSKFETLINPQRDIGPSHIHGLVSEDVLSAPTFSEIVGSLIDVLDGSSILAGHNVAFDVSFIRAEFDRVGLVFPDISLVCTMKLCGGGSLENNCRAFGIEFEGRVHSAFADAMATSKLLSTLLADSSVRFDARLAAKKPTWPIIQQTSPSPVTRSNRQQAKHQGSEYISRLLNSPRFRFGVGSSADSIQSYLRLLSDVLEDRVIDPSEGEALVEFAANSGLSLEQIQNAHKTFVLGLSHQAWVDGVVTEAEQRDLDRVAGLLGVDSELAEIMEEAKLANQTQGQAITPERNWFEGTKVCFTGACQCMVNGERITRNRSIELAEELGMVVLKGVTKKLDVLVVADPLSQSGKANKARQYGTRIMQARVFWRSLGLDVS